MIYLDTSVALAQLFAEDRRPPASLWGETLVTSRLTEYEVWNRVHARGLARAHEGIVRALLGRLAFVELDRAVLSRALESFVKPVRTLDALHLATIVFLHGQGQAVSLASYDERLVAAAKDLKIGITRL